ncbi:hypothetical protein Taro_015978 [Colocasia esculenta]|uniref:Protein phosphatase n=1 Tax=Colocasia esculenta TaxID=4460 RepID=A0A843UIZ8_COLES|nr:hypothetical protein [Colocasia esculenta]
MELQGEVGRWSSLTWCTSIGLVQRAKVQKLWALERSGASQGRNPTVSAPFDSGRGVVAFSRLTCPCKKKMTPQIITRHDTYGTVAGPAWVLVMVNGKEDEKNVPADVARSTRTKSRNIPSDPFFPGWTRGRKSRELTEGKRRRVNGERRSQVLYRPFAEATVLPFPSQALSLPLRSDAQGAASRHSSNRPVSSEKLVALELSAIRVINAVGFGMNAAEMFVYSIMEWILVLVLVLVLVAVSVRTFCFPLVRSAFCKKNAWGCILRSVDSFYYVCRLEMSFSTAVHLIPHPNKVDRGGEDAFFMSSYSGGVLGIADGVSGWAALDVDPALFSQELMLHASRLAEDEEANYDPQILMGKAHAATSSKGSATVILAMLDKAGTLKIASVGDCGLRVIHQGKVIFCTSPQDHYFDCPYQLSSETLTQTSLDAAVSSIQVTAGDTVVMGSDGLFDNVFDHEIVSTISTSDNVTNAAKALADLAREHSVDRNFDSPYSVEARNMGFDVPLWKKILGRKLTGGKPDDITVIVAQVTSS